MKKNNKGFTLAEMLIVVAIIAILITILSVTISKSLERAREATDLANLRNAISMLQAAVINDSDIQNVRLTISNNKDGKLVGKVVKPTTNDKSYEPGTYVSVIEITQKQAGWQLDFDKSIVTYTDSAGTVKTWSLTKSSLNNNVKYLYIGMNKDGEIYRISPHQQ